MKYRTWIERRGIPLPRNDAELALLSLWYFGKKLSFRVLRIYGNGEKFGGAYDVAQPYSSYHNNGFAYTGYSIEGYDSSAEFWKFVTGSLTCGGIASTSYGQFERSGYRHYNRLKDWIEFRHRKRISTPRQAFERLALNHGEGERTRILDMRPVSYGREDAA